MGLQKSEVANDGVQKLANEVVDQRARWAPQFINVKVIRYHPTGHSIERVEIRTPESEFFH
jgi:hypothetical protein